MKENDIYWSIDYNNTPFLMYIINITNDSYVDEDITYCKINQGVCMSKHISFSNFDNGNFHFIGNKSIEINQIKNLDLDYPEVFI